MRPVDGSISIFLPNVPDNKRADFGESLVHVSGNLIHPSLIWMRCYPRNLNATALEMYKAQHIVSDQATQCENFHGEEDDSFVDLTGQGHTAQMPQMDRGPACLRLETNGQRCSLLWSCSPSFDKAS